MNDAEVLIIGGGPAGSTCARELRRRGMDVAVLDKQTFPRDKVCAGWITPAVVDALELDLEDYGRERTVQPLHGFRISMIGRPEADVQYSGPVSYGIRRCEFDHYLLMRSGARLFLGEPLKDMHRDGDGHWVVNGHIRAPLVIGAGGHFCPVARHLGARPGRAEAAVAAKEVEFEMPREQARSCSVRADVPELYFCEDLKGYGWVFRKGDWLNIGLGRQDSHHLGHHLDAFMARLVASGRIPAPRERFQGHAYLLHGATPRRIIDDGVLLLGDAAGLAYARSGEGIRPAIESALLAADVVARRFRDGVDRAQLQAYVDQLEQRFGPRDNGEPGAAMKFFPVAWKQALAGKLLATRWFARHVVLNRWFFHLHQPPLKRSE